MTNIALEKLRQEELSLGVVLRQARSVETAKIFETAGFDWLFLDLEHNSMSIETACEMSVAALDAGRLKGVAHDVFASEPLPADHPLWAYDNVVVTPHCSAVYEGWDANSARMFAANLARYRKDEALANVVDPVRGY